jgi:threonine/homoserine/homoserine lactone efflux protein
MQTYSKKYKMKIKIISDGLKFGMILQVAIGPVCLFVFNEANTNGFFSAELGVFGVVIIDLLFVIFAITGITAFLNNERRKKLLKYFGAVILVLFGIDIIASQFNFKLLSSSTFSVLYTHHNAFIKGIIVTGSNPLTILFWSGIFSIKVNNNGYDKYDMYYFGIGAVIVTLLFLTMIGIIGSYISEIFPDGIIKILNIIIGVVFILFAVKYIYKNKNEIGKTY